ncbi:uncharacterized protein LOC125491896 [Beta vulgaris subsp. vulgaris]|uniref:uncharacterized protein LOC125491896 n=1 Tax=Beta vulgaris subsp. vulgaris TaxID=3555 RepID=UPI00254934C2|nr:uncharacterized protein LOC125491896 [Beta vulgaris subsp. vulgaris]
MNAWVGIYTEAKRKKGSGCNDEDVLTEAREMWIKVHGPRFTLEHAWNVLKTIQDAKFFVQKPDATGRMSASKLQKCTAAIRMLAYGSSSDAVDEYLKIASSTARECLFHFVEAVVARFGDEYLRKANANDIERLLHEGERRGFPGMMGSIDCMHWKEELSLGMERNRSPVFDDVLQGRAPEVNFSVNGTTYNMGYYLTDGIYPRWSTFIPAIKLPQTPNKDYSHNIKKLLEKM